MKRLIKKFLNDENGAVESLYTIVLLGLAAMVASFLIATSKSLDVWGKERMEIILMEEKDPEPAEGDFVPPEWIDPNNY